jgi:hypothetical protein
MAGKKNDKMQLSAPERRAVLRRLGRFATVSAPAVTLLLAAQTKPASAQPASGCRAGSVISPSDRNFT